MFKDVEDRTLQEININLTPDIIPYASVSDSDVGKWTIPQLKFWLN